MEVIRLKTTKRIELVDITSKVEEVVSKSKIKEGVCFLFCPHTTAGLTINENYDSAVRQDITQTLTKLLPPDKDYSHTEGNADSHIKSSIFGSSLVIFIENSRLCFGAWQGVFFCEGDGPRVREVWIKIISDIKD
ncbi:MAG: secondary thiamine-phosphate synthase enzyme YjbQ [Candidatus Omnitrophica bacterium]|nr:secondary thiamine-phosphate synthase enzyme YjbQ [Candidatus Omnitrophota bacterium]